LARETLCSARIQAAAGLRAYTSYSNATPSRSFLESRYGDGEDLKVLGVAKLLASVDETKTVMRRKLPLATSAPCHFKKILYSSRHFVVLGIPLA
jgi:hypothetical protein